MTPLSRLAVALGYGDPTDEEYRLFCFEEGDCPHGCEPGQVCPDVWHATAPTVAAPTLDEVVSYPQDPTGIDCHEAHEGVEGVDR